MMNIYAETESIIDKFQTRDPYELLDAIGAKTEICYNYEPGGLKGFSTILNRTMYAIINGHLNEHDRRIVAGHEAAHLILHKDEILLSPIQALQDFNLYDKSGRLEYEANSFLADFLVSDEDVLDAVSNDDHDYFANARELYIPPPLLAFKLHSMVRRDYKLRTPVGLQSSFLASESVW